MELPKTTLRDLLYCAGLLAAGFACFHVAINDPHDPEWFVSFLCPPFIGAGLGALHQRKLIGLRWGLLVSLGMVLNSTVLRTFDLVRE